MKNRIVTAICMMILLLCSSCDKWDDNGHLGGMWQLQEWRDGANQVIATKSNGIYYSFQLTMLSVRRLDCTPVKQKNASFRYEGDGIVVYDPLSPSKESGHETIASMDYLKDYGVDADGRFKIETLTDETLVLRRTDNSVLTFKKY